jgi:hypothetical protein
MSDIAAVCMNPSPDTLREWADRLDAYGFPNDAKQVRAAADAWELESATMQRVLEAGIASYNTLRQRLEAALLALWFEHYKDVYPEARIDHGDCAACRLLAALAAGKGGQ